MLVEEAVAECYEELFRLSLRILYSPWYSGSKLSSMISKYMQIFGILGFTEMLRLLSGSEKFRSRTEISVPVIMNTVWHFAKTQMACSRRFVDSNTSKRKVEQKHNLNAKQLTFLTGIRPWIRQALPSSLAEVATIWNMPIPDATMNTCIMIWFCIPLILLNST